MKVAISGAGVAGPTLAHWLLRAGHEPTLIEQAARFRTGGYVIDFWGLGYDIAEKMGILPAVLAAGYTLDEVRLVDREGRRRGGFSADVFRRAVGDRFTSLPRGDLARAIYATIEGRVETIFGDSIAALHDHGDRVGVVLLKAGPREFDVVVGADGLHSDVRALAFGAKPQFERPIGYYVAAFEIQGYRPRDELAYVAHARAGREVARFALRGDRTLFLFVFSADHMEGQPPAGVPACKAVLRRVFSDVGWECPQILDAMEDAPEFYFDRVSQIVAPHWSQGRVALVGDAASCVSLLAGEGTGLAMTQAYVLAGELARGGTDPSAAFRAYEARLRPFIEHKQASARAFARAFAPRTALGVWVRNLATRFMGAPAIADLLVGADLRDDFDLPAYAFASGDCAAR